MVKYVILGAFLLLMVLFGIFSSRKVKTTDDYVLGGRKIGPWLSAFAYGTTYFSAVIFVGYAGRFGWNFGLPPPGSASEMPFWGRWSPG
jgi:Na+/proline symporter